MDGAPEFTVVGRTPPVFRIDLSLPPSERYVALARLYRDRMRSLRGMFDDLVESISPRIPVKLVHWVARLCLRKLHTGEETEEIRGISRATDIDLYLLICLNTVLDLLMGCTSGGVRTTTLAPGSGSGSESQAKMLHFRTLDWGMDPLRDLIVQLEFVRGSDPQVLATSITYVGFVGVLTGVRKDLSVSLNFRPVHDPARDVAFYANHLLVLLGIRQSISSLLRRCILPVPSASHQGGSALSTLENIVANVPGMPTTAAYLIFSDGATTVTMEKDHRTAVVRSSSSFIVATNHDQQSGSAPPEAVAEEKRRLHAGLTLMASAEQTMADLIEDSNERRDCMQAKWDDKIRKHARARAASEKKEKKEKAEESEQSQGQRSSLRLRRKREEEQAEEESRRALSLVSSDSSDVAITQKEAISWLTTFPILNETTHYATIMDPSAGKVVWVRRYDPSEWE